MAERAHLIDLGRGGPAYDGDYAAWIAHQAKLLRSGRLADADVAHIAEEIEDLGKSEFRIFTSAIEVVLLHMLKWDHQPERRSRSWQASITEHRQRVTDELTDSPSYRRRFEEAADRAYRTARAAASRETGLPLTAFSERRPYDSQMIMTREHPLADD